MKYIFCLCFLSLLLTGCRETPEKHVVKKGKYFFDFDEVVYYKNNISEEDITAFFIKKDKTDDEQLLGTVLMFDAPESVQDTVVISRLEEIGYVKKRLSRNTFRQLNEIFSLKDYSNQDVAACAPFYRDIYIFKKKGKTVGVAKICYGCGISSFMGAKAPEDCFGKNSELEQLAKIVE